MRHLSLLLILPLLGLAACSDSTLFGLDDTILESQTLTMQAAKEVKMVPLNGEWDIALAPGEPVPCFAPNGDPVPIGFPTNTLTGTGHVTHLGKTTSVITFDACIFNPLDNSLIGPGTFVHTGAHGDAVTGTYVGVVYPDGTLSFSSEVADPPIVVDGGTGRFENATGWAEGAGMIDFETGTGTFWIEGMISSIGSSK